MLYYARGSENEKLEFPDIKTALFKVFDQLGPRKKLLAIPPDFTRFHSQAGQITEFVFEYYRDLLTDVLPAIGTHAPMNAQEKATMFGKIPPDIFRIHRWRDDLVSLGEISGEFLEEISEGRVNFSWPVQVNKLLLEGEYDLIISLGQVVPHEVIGMANYNKNILVGTGGKENIHKSHFLGAVFGMERIMGQIDNPVRQLLNRAAHLYLRKLPILYIHTVIGRNDSGDLVIRGLFIGDDEACFRQAAELSVKVNFQILEEPLKKIVVFLDPAEYKSTWLGNKSIYRTRMALADDGDLIIMAPGIHTFGEDAEIDLLIRKLGYRTTPEILSAVESNEDLADNLAAAAHLIHGSSENRFNITYCPGKLSSEDITSVNYLYADLDTMLKKYPPDRLKDGFTTDSEGEEVYYISKPALGLWATREKLIEQ